MKFLAGLGPELIIITDVGGRATNVLPGASTNNLAAGRTITGSASARPMSGASSPKASAAKSNLNCRRRMAGASAGIWKTISNLTRIRLQQSPIALKK